MKKGLAFLFLLFLGFSLIASVSASELGDSVRNLVKQVEDVVTPIAQFAFGVDADTWENLLVKTLIFVLLMIILVVALEKMPLFGNSSGIVWTIAVIIGILAMRLITTRTLLEFIWLPSGVVGMALVTLLPFVIYFYFVESFQGRTIRRTAWVLFAVIFVALALLRWDVLGKEVGKIGFNLGWMYLIVGAFAIISAIYDSYIRRIMNKLRKERAVNQQNSRILTKLYHDLNEARRVMADGGPGAEPARRAAEDIQRRINTFENGAGI